MPALSSASLAETQVTTTTTTTAAAAPTPLLEILKMLPTVTVAARRSVELACDAPPATQKVSLALQRRWRGVAWR